MIGWQWDLGSLCHFGLGLAGGILGFNYLALFAAIFTVVELIDYDLRWERLKEHTDKKPETWERTKQEFFEFLLGGIIASFLRVFLLK